jgi:hypothetical protein
MRSGSMYTLLDRELRRKLIELDCYVNFGTSTHAQGMS